MKTLYFQYDKFTGEVASYSDAPNIVSDRFRYAPINLDEATYTKLQENPIMRIEKGELVLKDQPHVAKKKLTQEKIRKAKSLDDIKEILTEFLT